METKQFKAESKRLLDLMINSIYTHKEIFLRELISNSSDAIDKIYYKALTDENIEFNKDDYFIEIKTDNKNRTLKIIDTGIGMTKDELEDSLGIIAKSGSHKFKEENEIKDGHDIIGQFGVGFYSAFMVADSITVVSKALGNDKAYKWVSEGVEGYTIEPTEKDTVGTEITLEIRENTEEENYDEYLEQNRLENIVKRYSDYIRYPIKMEVSKSKLKEGTEDEYEDYTEVETINNMVPIWKKNKNELTKEDYEEFYQEKHFGFDKPLKYIHTDVEGMISYSAILFIPENTPFDYYTTEYEKGLELYSNGVLIMEKCADLLPDYFGFVKGIVDSEDLSLNISREMLQHDRQLKLIAKNIHNKIKNELELLLKNNREDYEKFFESFGRQIKFGVYNDYGMHKDELKDLILFYSSSEEKLVSFNEYVENMKDDQKYIYYATGETIDRIDKLPQTEMVKDKGFEILYLTEDVDEFAIKVLEQYKDKEFKSVSSGDLGFEADEAEEKEKEEIKEENKEMFDIMKEALKDKVKDIKVSSKLKNHPVCFSTDGEVSIEMEKVLSSTPEGQNIKADKVLEINTDHKVFDALKEAYADDKEKLELYTNLLYDQALLIEGLPIEDPVEFTENITKIMI